MSQPLTEADLVFLERLARRIAAALYYGEVGPIGTNGSVSAGLMHDDYDRLLKMARNVRGEQQIARDLGRKHLPW
jgi:hypothetical protein